MLDIYRIKKDKWTSGTAGVWRIRTNQELGEPYKELDILVDIKKKRLEWVGHVVRMDQGWRFKKIFGSKPDRSKRRRRTRQ